jgi:UDP-N-acetylglucosamine 2-epimerase (non-hydrolysing)
MGIRKLDWEFCIHLTEDKSPFGQIGQILKNVETVIKEERPDKILILGDTNSGLSAIVAKRYDVPVYHMEAGNRCFDDTVPEETNRRIIDSCSDILMPYTERSRQNLLREGYRPDHIYVTGNPIGEVLTYYQNQIGQSNIIEELEILPKSYYLVTVHRAENVDNPVRMAAIVGLIRKLSEERKVIVSLHPHTKKRIDTTNQKPMPKNVVWHEPFGFFDFVYLEHNAYAVLSDSGTVQEECAILGVPNVTLRQVTERPETIECGSGCLAGWYPNDVKSGIDFAVGDGKTFGIPERYTDQHVSTTVMKILLGRSQ